MMEGKKEGREREGGKEEGRQEGGKEGSCHEEGRAMDIVRNKHIAPLVSLRKLYVLHL